MRWLLDRGADPNVLQQFGQKIDVLTLAAARSTPSVVRLLVEHGARTKGIQALHAAATTSAVEMDQGNYEPVPSRVEILAILLDHGADVNEMETDPKELKRPRYFFNGRPLHRAVQYGSVEAVQCLLAYGADVSAPGWSGLNALKAAEMTQRQDIIDELRKHIDRASGQSKLTQGKQGDA